MNCCQVLQKMPTKMLKMKRSELGLDVYAQTLKNTSLNSYRQCQYYPTCRATASSRRLVSSPLSIRRPTCALRPPSTIKYVQRSCANPARRLSCPLPLPRHARETRICVSCAPPRRPRASLDDRQKRNRSCSIVVPPLSHCQTRCFRSFTLSLASHCSHSRCYTLCCLQSCYVC
jgi:hypothetical protein